MTIATAAAPSPMPQIPYAVLIEQGEGDRWSAQVLGWPNFHAEGSSREGAIASLKEVLQALLSRAELIYLDPPKPMAENSLMKYAGMFEDDPQFDEVLSEIQAYRQEIDVANETLLQPSEETL